MNKKVLVGVGILVVLLIAMAIGTAVYIENRDNPTKIKETDAIKFKKEYESLNGKISYEDYKNISLEISENNIVKYVTEKEAVNIIDNKTGIIYFGFASCPWCRSMLPVLLNALENNGVKDLYYLDVLDIRSTMELNENNEVVVLRKGTLGYYDLLQGLDSELDDYVLTYTNSKGKEKEVLTGEKRLYAPSVAFIKNGEIVGFHEGTVDSQKNPYEPLTTEQQEELNDIYEKLIRKVYDNSCNNGSC